MATQTESLVVTLDANVSGYTAKLAQADSATEKLSTTTKKSDKQLANFSRRSGMAGIQFQQFIGQIQGGQSAMVALSQQSADLGFVLGAPLLGAVAGISASIIGMLLPALFSADENVKTLNESTETLTKTFRNLSKEQQQIVVSGLQEKLKEQVKEYGELTTSVRGLEREYASSKFLSGQSMLSFFADPQESLKELTAAKIATTKLGVELEATAEKIRGFSEEDQASINIVNELILAIQEKSNLLGASARAIDLSTAAVAGANGEDLKRINIIHDEIDAQKEKNRVLAEGNKFANIGVTEADPELLRADLLYEQRLRDEESFLEAMAEIKFTGLETEAELFFKQQEMHQLLLDNKLISEEEFAKAQAAISKKYAKGLKTEEKVVTQTEAQKLNTRQTALRAGMALNTAFFEDNKAVAAGLIVADTATGMQKALAIDPINGWANATAIAITGAANLATALGASKGGGSSPSAPTGGGGTNSPQQDFQAQTSSLDLTDSSSSGSTQQTITFGSDTGDDLVNAIAEALNKGMSEGRFT